MNKTSTDYDNVISTNFLSLVRSGLGYCCLHAFFSFHRQTRFIVARLGISRATVKRWKARWRAGEFPCTHCSDCMARKVTFPIPRKAAKPKLAEENSPSEKPLQELPE